MALFYLVKPMANGNALVQPIHVSGTIFSKRCLLDNADMLSAEQDPEVEPDAHVGHHGQ